jgi:hypothetical protein
LKIEEPEAEAEAAAAADGVGSGGSVATARGARRRERRRRRGERKGRSFSAQRTRLIGGITLSSQQHTLSTVATKERVHGSARACEPVADHTELIEFGLAAAEFEAHAPSEHQKVVHVTNN